MKQNKSANRRWVVLPCTMLLVLVFGSCQKTPEIVEGGKDQVVGKMTPVPVTKNVPEIKPWSEVRQLAGDEPIAYLRSLLKSDQSPTVKAFFETLLTAEESDLPLFKQAFGESGDVFSLTCIGPVLRERGISFVDELGKKQPKMSEEEEKAAQKKESARIETLFNSLAPEIGKIAERDSAQLIAEIKAIFHKGDKVNIVNLIGPTIGLQSLGEKGFELVLSSIQDQDDQIMASMLLEPMGARAILPVLKMYENPATPSSQRLIAAVLISLFPLDNEEVLDKVVEAYKHGRYLQTNIGTKGKDGKITIDMKDAVNLALSNWKLNIERAGHGKRKVIDNIAKRYLADPDGQSEMISLLAKLDFQMAAPYLEQLDPTKLSDESIDMMFRVCQVPDHIPSLSPKDDERPYLEERCRLFGQFFFKCQPSQREKALYLTTSYPAEMMANFFIDNFDAFTDKEKMTLIFSCGSTLDKPFPIDLRDKVFARIRLKCTDEQKRTIDYLLKKKQSDKKLL